MTPITDESFELVDGWDFVADASRYLVRTGGWTVRNTSGNITQSGPASSASAPSNQRSALYQQSSGGSATNVQLTGQINQAVQIFRDDDGDGSTAEGSDFDRRTYFKLFVREQARPRRCGPGRHRRDVDGLHRLPLPDQHRHGPQDCGDGRQHLDEQPYTSIVIAVLDQAYARAVDTPGTTRNFGIVVDVGTHSRRGRLLQLWRLGAHILGGGITGATYAGGTLTIHGARTQAPTRSRAPRRARRSPSRRPSPSWASKALRSAGHTARRDGGGDLRKVQYLLRQNSDIDSTDQSVTGKTADALLVFVGDTLNCGSLAPVNPNGGGRGVHRRL